MNSPSEGGWLLRNRNWVLAAVMVIAVMGAALLAGRHGTGSTTGSVKLRFGPSVTPPAGALVFTNGWVVSSGRQSVAVYAGSQPHHPRNGLLLVRVNVPGRPSRAATRVLSGTGALTLLRPSHIADMRAAMQATLEFVTASGRTGTLAVATVAVSLTR